MPFGVEGLKVAVFRALNLGDLLVAVPALRALRKGLPGAHITLIGLPWARALLERFPRYIDDFMPFPGFPGLPEAKPDVAKLPEFLKQVQERRFDLALQMHGSGAISNLVVSLFNAGHCAGFTQPGAYTPDPEFFLPYPEQIPEVERGLALMRHLGFLSDEDWLEFPLFETDWERYDDLVLAAGIQPGSVVIHPGASTPARRWDEYRFALLAEWLADSGYPLVVTGTDAERSITARVLNKVRGRAVDLTGRTDLGTLAALLIKSRLLICNDTGVSHLAEAVGARSVVLFSGSDPARWAPRDSRRHRPIPDAQHVTDQAIRQIVSVMLSEISSPATRPAPAVHWLSGGAA